MPPPPRRRPGPAWGHAFEASLEAGLSVVIGVVAGYYADRWLGTRPFLMLALMVAGGIAAVRRLLQLAESARPRAEDATGPASSAPPASPGPRSATDPPGTAPRGGEGERRRERDED